MADASEAASVKVGTASTDAKSSATAEVKFETDRASSTDVEVALEAVAAEAEFKSVSTVVAEASAAEAEFKEEANAEVTIKVAKAAVMEANFTAAGANSVSISAAASDQVGLQIASEMNECCH